jgi:hypothetical protein
MIQKPSSLIDIDGGESTQRASYFLPAKLNSTTDRSAGNWYIFSTDARMPGATLDTSKRASEGFFANSFSTANAWYRRASAPRAPVSSDTSIGSLGSKCSCKQGSSMAMVAPKVLPQY